MTACILIWRRAAPGPAGHKASYYDHCVPADYSQSVCGARPKHGWALAAGSRCTDCTERLAKLKAEGSTP